MTNSNVIEEPFLGRMVIEIIKEDATNYLKDKMGKETGVSKEFLDKLDLQPMDEDIDPVTGRKSFKIAKRRVPISKGKIVKMAPDCFGDVFTNKYGHVGYTPTIGDTVLFIPNESYKLDVADEHHLVADCDIVAYVKTSVNSETTSKEVINE